MKNAGVAGIVAATPAAVFWMVEEGRRVQRRAASVALLDRM